MDRVLLLNDTANQTNAGCRAVGMALTDLLGRKEKPVSLKRFSVGFFRREFGGLLRELGRPPTHGEWLDASARFIDGNPEALWGIPGADLVVANAEGSVHHDSPNALSLCTLLWWAGKCGRRTLVVNATFMDMTPGILQEALAGAEWIHLRERRSLGQLGALANDRKITVAPDLAVLAVAALPLPERGASGAGSGPAGEADRRPRCVIVPAVSRSQPESMLLLIDAALAAGCRVTCMGVNGEANRESADLRSAASSRGIDFVSSGEMRLEELLGWLSGFDCAVSGRHHINYFLMRAGVPFIPTPSNTWKIEATCELLGHGMPFCRDAGEVKAGLCHLLEDLPGSSRRVTEAFGQAGKMMEVFLEDWKRYYCQA